ncbi:septal ring lytic transglycosylase RlpA family protein [Silvibacterium dinghuense]|nr:septal ring lytic transglycosylase RlpA family protein [Silvibacterium dinghuense]GGH06666.1 hypothetical protein GCM10011586_23550 [Silvibacterium dinghuense]
MARFRNTVSRQYRRLLQHPRLLIGMGAFAIAGTGSAGTMAYYLRPVEPLPASISTTQYMQATVSAQQALMAPPKSTHKSFNPLRGLASWYGSVLHGHTTASGEVFDESQMTACHNSLPFGTRVRVTDLNSNKSVVVRINDRGVLSSGRIIDLSSAAAEKLGILRAGIARVKLEVLGTPAHPDPGKS